MRRQSTWRLTVRGQSGSIMYGYHLAAALGWWTITRTKDNDWSLSAEIRRVDPLRIRQRDLYLTAPRLGSGDWHFRIRELAITGRDTLTAALDPPSAAWSTDRCPNSSNRKP